MGHFASFASLSRSFVILTFSRPQWVWDWAAKATKRPESSRLRALYFGSRGRGAVFEAALREFPARIAHSRHREKIEPPRITNDSGRLVVAGGALASARHSTRTSSGLHRVWGSMAAGGATTDASQSWGSPGFQWSGRGPGSRPVFLRQRIEPADKNQTALIPVKTYEASNPWNVAPAPASVLNFPAHLSPRKKNVRGSSSIFPKAVYAFEPRSA